MARLPYVHESDVTGQPLRGIYDEIIALRGGNLNLYRLLGNHPEALRAFMTMSRHVRNENFLAPQLRELAILATAYALDIPYEKAHHLAAARAEGIPEAKLQSFPHWGRSALFTPEERAVMAYAHQVARTRSVDDAVFERVREHLTVEQLVDLVVTCAWYHFCAALILPMQLDLETPAST
ncbi:MAG TPA: carboxymuconolactone decarboxylase family protein [Candidatus Dormibacteraeota bacterium]|nr:carboxymuconolactone decarboxylase family protein [Candidatus Dormibacteraeota bacterium]